MASCCALEKWKRPETRRKLVLDPYLISGTDCLENLLGDTDPDELRIHEAQRVAIREAQLARRTLRRTFDADHLRTIHRWLFQDVYAWAGDFRSVPISRGVSEFAQPRFIENEMNRIATELRRERQLREVSVAELPDRLVYYFGELNALHPFREGNGRVQRLFLSHMLELRRLILAWGAVSTAEMVAVSVAVHHGDAVPLRTLIGRIIESY
jgi:cell filamentation protein